MKNPDCRPPVGVSERAEGRCGGETGVMLRLRAKSSCREADRRALLAGARLAYRRPSLDHSVLPLRPDLALLTQTCVGGSHLAEMGKVFAVTTASPWGDGETS